MVYRKANGEIGTLIIVRKLFMATKDMLIKKVTSSKESTKRHWP
jgi:hypothetical protein